MRNKQYNSAGWGSFETQPWGKMKRILKSLGKRSTSYSTLWGKRGFSEGTEARLEPTRREKKALMFLQHIFTHNNLHKLNKLRPWLDEETETAGNETVTTELMDSTLYPFNAPRGRRSVVGYGGWGKRSLLAEEARSGRNKKAVPPMSVIKEEDSVADTVHDVRVTKLQREPFTNGFSISNLRYYYFPNIVYRIGVSKIY